MICNYECMKSNLLLTSKCTVALGMEHIYHSYHDPYFFSPLKCNIHGEGKKYEKNKDFRATIDNAL